MKNVVIGLVVLLVAAGVAVTALRGPAKPELNIYTWSDYFNMELIAEFEEKFDCRVVLDIFTSNEDANVRIQNGADRYDLLTPSSYMVSLWRQQGRLAKLDPAKIPNLAGVDREFLAHTEDPEMAHSVPYTRTVTGVGYNAKHVGEDVDPSWAIFADARFKGRMTMLDDPREMMAAALMYLRATKAGGDATRYSINTTDDAEIAEAADVLVAWKKNLERFDVDGAKTGLQDGKYYAVQQYNGDMAVIMSENGDIRFFVPKEGSSLASDDFVILKNSPHADLAHAFINFMIDPDNAARNMSEIMYYMPVPAAHERLAAIDPDLVDNPAFNIQNDVLTRCEVLRDLGDGLAKYTRAYERVLAAP